MNKTISYRGNELKLVELTGNLNIGNKLDYDFGGGLPNEMELINDEIIIKSGSKFYLGDNPYNCGQLIIISDDEYEIDIAIEEDDEKLIKYL